MAKTYLVRTSPKIIQLPSCKGSLQILKILIRNGDIRSIKNRGLLIVYKIAIVGSTSSGKSALCQALREVSVRGADGMEISWMEVHDCEEVESLDPDVILQAVDSTDLDESLVLTPQLIDMHRRLILVFTHYDQLLATGHSLDISSLEKQMGVLARIVNPLTGEGIDDLTNKVVHAAQGRVEEFRHVHVDYGQDVMHAVKRIVDFLARHMTLNTQHSKRYLAIRLLERPAETLPLFSEEACYEQLVVLVERERALLSAELKRSPEERDIRGGVSA